MAETLDEIFGIETNEDLKKEIEVEYKLAQIAGKLEKAIEEHNVSIETIALEVGDDPEGLEIALQEIIERGDVNGLTIKEFIQICQFFGLVVEIS